MNLRRVIYCLILALLLAWLCPVEFGHLRKFVFGPDLTPPFAFRLLVPKTLYAVASLTGWSLKDIAPVAFGVLNFALFILYAIFAGRFYGERGAYAAPGILFALMLEPNGMVFPWDSLGAIFFILLALTVIEKNIIAWYALFTLSIFNRETAICLVPVLFCSLWKEDKRRAFIHAGFSALIWIAVKSGMLFFIGGEIGQDKLARNLEIWPCVFFAFHGLWALAVFGYSKLTREMKILFIAVPFYAAAMFAFGALDEPRIWTDLFPFVILAILAGLGMKPKGAEA